MICDNSASEADCYRKARGLAPDCFAALAMTAAPRQCYPLAELVAGMLLCRRRLSFAKRRISPDHLARAATAQPLNSGYFRFDADQYRPARSLLDSPL
ncbi:MAG: hypothetical protein V5B40_10950 [Candidatus Accumulibacter meliphilus]|jgi:hypothetical protein|uniref:hypothetical protein n=1 Tax=Candidatus Accumulibacter meliphilus TaxID=2211374 RepID=UPI002FC2CB94